MRKGFLIKTLIMTVVLATVLTVIILATRGHFSTASDRTTQQTFFEQFIIAGGPIVWFVLLPMSLVTIYLAAEHSLTIRRKKLLPEGISGKIIETIQRFGHRQLATKIAEDDDFVSTAVTKAVTQGRGDWFRMKNVLAESLQDQAWELMRKIEWVNLIGNVSPMVGLFGTVYGMIKLFNAIVIAGGQPQPAQLAEGISIALVTTFWGLFIAIPALAVYGVFRNRIETLASDAVLEAENIMPEIIRSIKKQTQPAQPEKSQPIREIKTKSIESLHQPSQPQ
ncbi:MAG: MotA/TolQ/ExbB proton channel family protein [Planctomycetes bacterium]|nr:MotA/TolQ/ExbB proton channel family protein [Planctomycetota bacterium]